MKFQSILGLLLSLLLIASCSSDDDNALDNVRGKYVLDALSTTGCNDSSENFSLAPNGDKLCATQDGTEVCIDVCMEFTEDMYKVKIVTSAAGFSLSQMDEGSFDRSSGTGQVCIDGECQNIKVSNGGKTIEVSTTDDDTGCVITMKLKRQ